MRGLSPAAFAVIAALGLGLGCGAPAAPPDEATLRANMRAAGVPGLQAAVIVNDEVAWHGAYGLADLEAGVEVDARSLFIVASLSKTVITVTTLRLWSEGRLQLDDPIDGLLGFPVRHPDHPEVPITVRHLLTHSSGIVDDFVSLGRLTTDGDSEVGLEEFARGYVTPGNSLFSASHFGAAPGAAYSYSNAGFGVLGAILEAVTGESVPALTQRLVFDPAGMSRSKWRLADVDPAHLATPYAGTWEGGFTALPHTGAAYYPATTLKSTATELADYLLAVMRDRRDGQARLLPREAAALLGTPQIPDLDPNQGLGWYYESYAGRRYLGHTGSTTGSSAFLMLDEGDGVGLVLLTNSDAFVRARLGAPEGRDALIELLNQLDAWARDQL